MDDTVFTIRRNIQFDVFDYQTLSIILADYNKPRDKITKLIKDGIIIRIKKGLYCFGKDLQKQPLSLELIANLVYGPSYISGKYALSYYGLIPERVAIVTSVTVNRSKYFNTPVGNFSYQMIKNERYSIGADQIYTGDISFLIATPEKALVDEVWNDKRLKNSSLSDFETYLTEDLRIDIEQLLQLSEEKFISIIKKYDSLKIRNLLKCIQNMRKNKNA